MTLGKKDEQIVKAIILLADSIGMTTIAEGVETQAQYNKLAQLGSGRYRATCWASLCRRRNLRRCI